MAKSNPFWLVIVLIAFSGCERPKDLAGLAQEEEHPIINLTEEELQDKVLGMIVGSAIGDAMGAPTEMWSREQIDLEYGWVDGLDSMVREVSPEGIWIPNLPAGGTTDDTRWKKLIYEYLIGENNHSLDAKRFASQILSHHEASVANFREIEGTDPEPYQANILRVSWLQEWAKVSKPFIEDDLIGYMAGLSTFYGGEMVCAGLLYAPAIGVFFPDQPEKAYKEAYKLAIYDQGYARDISSLSAAMTSAAMRKNATQEEVLDVLRSIDPEGYFQSRLVGRSSYRILQRALSIVSQAKKAEADTLEENQLTTPSREQILKAYLLLDQNLQDMPFHAGEIHLQVLTALIFSNFDFELTLQFLVNYGRDNDTTAAVAGAILGAYLGFDRLPEQMKVKVMAVNTNILGIDLNDLSQKLTFHMLSGPQK